MEATVGDQICIRGGAVGHPDKEGEIVEVRGAGGEPPYLVRFAGGAFVLIGGGFLLFVFRRDFRTDKHNLGRAG